METFFSEIGKFALNAFTSLFANRVDQKLQKMDIVKNFKEVDESIINEIGDKVSEEYSSEKLKEQVMKDRSFLSREIDFITQEEREEFIDGFYKKNPDLKYVGHSRINECLNSYIDMINKELNKRISQEGKVIIGRIQKSEENIVRNQNSNTENTIRNQNSNTEKIIQKLDELGKNSQQQITYRNYNIPAASKLFYGREEHLNKLLDTFKNTNLVFINGLGGIGKTQIAKKYVSEHKQEYNIVVWISAENVEELNSSYRQVALFYNLIENNKEYEQKNVDDLVKNYLNEIENSIIIIDGVDDVEVNDLIDYLPSNANVIVTTQNSNIDADEFNVIPVGDFTEDEAINFILSNTSNRVCDENDLDEAKKLTLLMGYYPLALEYSRAYINKHRISIKDYKELFQEHRISLLTNRLASYKKTIYTAWKISFDKATERNRNAYDVMAMCSYFASVRIPFRDIFSKSDYYKIFELIEIEENLLNYSLITIDGEHISVHGITQEFVRSMLDQKDESIKYLEKDIGLLISNFPQRIDDRETNGRVVDLLPHARKVFDFCRDKKINKTDEFCGNIGKNLYVIGMYVESIEYINTAIELYFENNEYFRGVEYTTFLIQAYHYTGNSKKALVLSNGTLNLIEKEDSLTEVQKEYLNGNILGATGIVQKDLGKIDTALSCFEKSLAYYERIGDVDGQVNQLNNIGIIYKYQEEYGLAMDIYGKALELCDQDKRNKGKILGNIGFIYKIQNDILKAFTAFSEALKISQEIGDLRSECIDYHHMAECWLQIGNASFTEENLEKSLEIAKKTNFVMGIINVNNTYGVLNLKIRNNLVKAKEYFEQAYCQSNQVEYAHGKEYASFYLQYIDSIS